MLPENPLAIVRRQFIDIQRWLAAAKSIWAVQAADARVSIEHIIPSELGKVWTSQEGLNQILHHVIADAIDSSIAGDRIEVEVREPEEATDWLTISVRDCAGGRPATWSLDKKIQGLAKQLEGYIDVANHPGRSTVCSLHIPTGKLQGWLRRQSASMRIHHVSWSPMSKGGSTIEATDSGVDQALQMTMSVVGSLVPVGERAFLCSTSSPIDKEAILDSIMDRVRNTGDMALSAKNLEVRCDCLGTMQEFLQRIEQSLLATSGITIPLAAEDGRSEVAVRLAHEAGRSENPRVVGEAIVDKGSGESNIRIDAAGLSPTPLSDRVPQPSRFARTLGNRIRPRRVSTIQD